MRFGKYLTTLTKPELDYFLEQCNFSEEEEIIFNMLAKGKSLTEISIKTQNSITTVRRRIYNIKGKVAKTDGKNH